ncbi:equilibrative nucleoside transporter 1 [Anaeramoeba flamelloides]|uniref:Equilibrative nucleoside transporter 1 n=1 Tax=Anaeramoeba flamelloides TaxID=1746091 RepID=A0ABQ8Y1N6_9EUKA|nr:equilibrative nucleoside transporter 1 [Anaeramoeba flamelloides]
MSYKPNSQPPKDKANVAYFFFTLMGVAHLLPFNAFLTAFDYFNTNLSKVSKSFEFYFSSIMTWGTFIALGFDLFISSYIQNKKSKLSQEELEEENKKQKLRFTPRVVGSYIIYILTTGSVPIIMLLCPLKVAFGIMMVNVVLVGFSTGICQGGIFGFAAIFEPKYTTAIMSGQGFAGVIVSFLRLITKGATKQTTKGIRDSAFAYFAASAGIVFFIIIGYFVLINTKFAKYYISKYYYHLHHSGNIQDTVGINESGRSTSTESENENEKDNLKTKLIQEDPEIDEPTSTLLGGAPKQIKLWPLYKKIFRFSFSVFFVFLITLALFPSVLVQIPSTRNHLNTTGWYALILITLFNCLDTVGRTLPRWLPNLFSNNFLVGFVVTRLVFYVLFVLCVEKVIFTDAVSIIIVIIFSITNGYPSSISMMRGPFAEGVQEHERSTAAVMMVSDFQFFFLFLFSFFR